MEGLPLGRDPTQGGPEPDEGGVRASGEPNSMGFTRHKARHSMWQTLFSHGISCETIKLRVVLRGEALLVEVAFDEEGITFGYQKWKENN